MSCWNSCQSEANPDTCCVHIGERAAVAASRYEGGYWSGQCTWQWDEGKGEGVFGAHREGPGDTGSDGPTAMKPSLPPPRP